MKLDFEENEGKQEIKIAELLSKLKEKDGIIDSQASVKRDLEDDIEALKKRIAILTRKRGSPCEGTTRGKLKKNTSVSIVL